MAALFRFQVVQVFVERFAGVDFVLDAVDGGQDNRAEGEVRIRAGIRATELDALGFRALAVHRDAAAGGTVALRIRQIHRRFVTRHEPFVTVGGGVGEGE